MTYAEFLLPLSRCFGFVFQQLKCRPLGGHPRVYSTWHSQLMPSRINTKLSILSTCPSSDLMIFFHANSLSLLLIFMNPQHVYLITIMVPLKPFRLYLYLFLFILYSFYPSPYFQMFKFAYSLFSMLKFSVTLARQTSVHLT